VFMSLVYEAKLARWRPSDNDMLTKVPRLSRVFREYALMQEGYRRKDIDRAVLKLRKEREAYYDSSDEEDNGARRAKKDGKASWVGQLKKMRKKQLKKNKKVTEMRKRMMSKKKKKKINQAKYDAIAHPETVESQ
jgi:hypothetical protein